MKFSPMMQELCSIAAVNYPALREAVRKLATSTTKLQNAKLKQSKSLSTCQKAYQKAKADLDAITATMNELSKNIQEEIGFKGKSYALMTVRQNTFIMKVSNVELSEANGKVVVSVQGDRPDTKQSVNVILVDDDPATHMELIEYPY